jgi:hypothetical protein
MANPVVAGGCYGFNIGSVGGTWSWTVQVDNTQGLGQLFKVQDINTPYGSLYTAMIPIPGDVILAMADSLSDVQGQLAPQLALTQGSVSSFNIVITEGDSNVNIGSVGVQNVGSFGSFMVATATPTVSFIQTTPSYIGDLGKNDTGNFDFTLLTGTLLNASSPYMGTVNLQDNRNVPTTVPISFTITVNPRPVISAVPLSLAFTHSLSLGTSSGAQQVEIENVGPASSVLNFTLARVNNNSPWIDFIPTSGGPLNSGDSTLITFSVVKANVPLSPGVYQDTIRVSSPNAANSPVDITVALTVSA